MESTQCAILVADGAVVPVQVASDAVPLALDEAGVRALEAIPHRRYKSVCRYAHSKGFSIATVTRDGHVLVVRDGRTPRARRTA